MNCRRGCVVAALFLAAPPLAACSTSSGPSQPSAPSTGNSIGVLLVDDVPAGFTAHSDAAAHTGSTDLAKAVGDDAQPDARTALTAEGFQNGYQRLWSDGSGDVIGVQIYRFASVAGARANVQRADRIARAQAQRVTAFTVAGTSAAMVTGYEVDVEGNRTEQVNGVAGPLVMQLICTSRTDSKLRERAQSLAREQYRRIAGA